MAKDAPRQKTKARYLYSPDELQRVQDYEDKTNEAVMLLEANADILTSLREYYERLVNNKDFTVGGTSSEDVVDFAIQLKDMGYDLKMQIARGKLLAKVTADRKTLVSLYNYSTNPNLMLYNIQVLIYSRFCSTYRARQRRKWR
jgi:hypothetical protein